MFYNQLYINNDQVIIQTSDGLQQTNPYIITDNNDVKMTTDFTCNHAYFHGFTILSDIRQKTDIKDINVCLTKNSIKEIVSLMGVAVQDALVQWKGEKWQERGPLLITHWGISGPAAIKLAAWHARL